MLTNDQCIQVAEKVWGWVGEFWSEDAWETPDGNGWIGKINDEVNSWSGFGRTVEAIAERKVYFIGNGFYWWNDFGHQSVSIEWKSEKPLEIIEATHLAALEAVREGK